MSWCFNCEADDKFPTCCGVHFCGVWVYDEMHPKGGYSCGKLAICKYHFINDGPDDPDFYYCVDHIDQIEEADKEGRYDDEPEDDDDEQAV